MDECEDRERTLLVFAPDAVEVGAKLVKGCAVTNARDLAQDMQSCGLVWQARRPAE
jgi:hypothetical protein